MQNGLQDNQSVIENVEGAKDVRHAKELLNKCEGAIKEGVVRAVWCEFVDRPFHYISCYPRKHTKRHETRTLVPGPALVWPSRR